MFRSHILWWFASPSGVLYFGMLGLMMVVVSDPSSPARRWWLVILLGMRVHRLHGMLVFPMYSLHPIILAFRAFKSLSIFAALWVPHFGSPHHPGKSCAAEKKILCRCNFVRTCHENSIFYLLCLYHIILFQGHMRHFNSLLFLQFECCEC